MSFRRGSFKSFAISIIQIITIISQVLTEEPRFAEPIPNVTVALGRDASLPCVVEHLGTYKISKYNCIPTPFYTWQLTRRCRARQRAGCPAGNLPQLVSATSSSPIDAGMWVYLLKDKWNMIKTVSGKNEVTRPRITKQRVAKLAIREITCAAHFELPLIAERKAITAIALGAGQACSMQYAAYSVQSAACRMQCTVAWIHIDRQMILTIHRHVITRLARFSVSHDNAMTWLLHVSQVQQEDRGYYMCQVNTNPMISQVGYLQVVVPPNILDEESTQSAVAVRENQNISLVCKADGFPTPKIMWRREDGQPISVDRRKKVTVYEGDSLSLQRISRTEMGAYLCIATNAVPPSVSKRIIVDVEFSPMIWVPNQLVGAPAGTDVTVDCHTEAHPRAISYWVYDNVMVLPTKKYAVTTDENSYRAHMKLTVRNLQSGDFGNYRCISKNSLGETEGSIRLYEIPMPSTSPKATEMKSTVNKESVRRANVSRAVQREHVREHEREATERPSVVRAQLDRAPERDAAHHVYRAPHPQHASGTVDHRCWRHTYLVVILLVQIDFLV
ncbi:Lachesin [Papilio machaon]|uniref:Lachesin n=1 Tax=Papilio machaon TaxID=76193 RepID=A0A0N0PCF9_PAPMA|nr:Lachesin [Papilio machaon]